MVDLRLPLVWFVVAFAVGVSACQSNSGFTTGRDSFDLSDTQRTKAEHRAAAGDLEAAQKLLEYHAFISGDETEVKRWQKRVDQLRRTHGTPTI